LAGSENADLEYVVGKGLTEDSPFFLTADLAECGFTWKMRQCCEREHVEALKVGLFLFELEKTGEWKEVPMLEDDDMADWVDVGKVSEHAMEACNGKSVAESSKKGIY
jgi:hypothetical protein